MKIKRENKGFSLVELVVVIAIFSVVSIAIGGFLLAAQRSYAVSANELDIQEEAQLVANQLQEMILDTSLGISYQYVVVDDTGATLTDYMLDDSLALPTGELTKKELYIYGSDYYYHIYWNKEKSELYLIEYDKSGATPQLADGMPSEGVVLGEFVSDFKVDLSKIATDRMVSFDITFKKPGVDRSYMVSRNVSIRNNILTNRSATDVYDAVGLEFEPVADYLNITPGSALLWPGETLPFNIILTCSRGGVPSQDVSWSYSSGDGIPLSAETRVNASGVLKIASEEKSTVINLVGSAPGKNYGTDTDIVLQKNVVVNVKQITGLTISRNDFATNPIAPGGLYVVDVGITGVNLSGETLAGTGGVAAAIEMGSSYASIISQEDIGGLTTRFTIQLSSSAPTGGDIALSFRPTRAEFTDVTAGTGIFKVGNASSKIFNITSESGTEWLRLGFSKVNIDFTDASMRDSYCDAGGNLKSGYYVRYHYQVYDSNYNLTKSAYKSTGNNGNLYTDYFTSTGSSTSETTSVLYMTDKIFLTSGTVVVRAELMHNTAGSQVVVGSSDNLSFTIPQATIGFRRAAVDTPSNNLKAYMTENMNVVPIYISFSTGFAQDTYSINVGGVTCTPSTLAAVSFTASDFSRKKVAIQGSDSAEYVKDKNNIITVTYGGLPNKVTIQMVEPNISGTDCYAPLNNSEWTKGSSSVSGGNTTQYYTYYIDDTHKMEMSYVNDVFQIASYYVMRNNVWEKVADYTMNRVTTSWDLVTP